MAASVLSWHRVSRLNVNRFAAALRGLGILLASLLLVCELLTSDGSFHQSLHASGTGTSNNCLLCLFLKGHIDLPETAPPVLTPVEVCFGTPRQLDRPALPDTAYLLSPSRAPPASIPSQV
jgi:hypothetical protein